VSYLQGSCVKATAFLFSKKQAKVKNDLAFLFSKKQAKVKNDLAFSLCQ
jgi:hypothetical protein